MHITIVLMDTWLHLDLLYGIKFEIVRADRAVSIHKQVLETDNIAVQWRSRSACTCVMAMGRPAPLQPTTELSADGNVDERYNEGAEASIEGGSDEEAAGIAEEVSNENIASVGEEGPDEDEADTVENGGGPDTARLRRIRWRRSMRRSPLARFFSVDGLTAYGWTLYFIGAICYAFSFFVQLFFGKEYGGLALIVSMFCVVLGSFMLLFIPCTDIYRQRRAARAEVY